MSDKYMSEEQSSQDETRQEGPLTIEGFDYLRRLGNFSIGNSYLYFQREENRRVHVLLAKQSIDPEEFVRLFLEAIGDESDDLLLYAGLTDLGRPYLVTDFIDDESVGSKNIDDTIIVDRSDSLDETLLSSAQNPDDLTMLSARSSQASHTGPAARAPKRELPSLVVSERQAFIPDPDAPASDAIYPPRALPQQTAGSGLSFSRSQLVASAPPISRRMVEQRRARGALIAVASSVLFSSLGVVVLVWWLFDR